MMKVIVTVGNEKPIVIDMESLPAVGDVVHLAGKEESLVVRWRTFKIDDVGTVEYLVHCATPCHVIEGGYLRR